jgi:hypothetical protein
LDEVYALIAIGLCIFAFLLVLLGIGEFYGGDLKTIAEGVAKFVMIIVAFAYGCFVVMRLIKK